MEDESNLRTVWRALAESKRRQIIELLEERPRTTSELCDYFDVSRFAVMKHLNVLEQADLIRFRREGRWRWNILNDELVQSLRTRVADGNHGPDKLSEILDSFPSSYQVVTGATSHVGTVNVQHELLLPSSPDRVFRALTEGVDEWWCHRTSPDSLGVYLEPFVNGRLYEAFDANGQGELYATVTYIKRDEEIRLSGSMGLTGTATLSLVQILLALEDGRTQLRLIHHMIGDVDKRLVERFDRYWHDLLGLCLKAFVEEGISYRTLKERADERSKASLVTAPNH